MPGETDIPVVILGGGASRRFGSPKGLAQLNGKSLAETVIDRVRRQTRAPVLVNADPSSPYASLGLETLSDPVSGGLGPLAGILAAMSWADAEGRDRVATVPIDTPFLPPNLLQQLEMRGAPAICASRGRAHFVCGLWSADLRTALQAFLNSGERAAKAWAKRCGAKTVPFSDDKTGRDPFFNINTKEDLSQAKQWIDPSID